MFFAVFGSKTAEIGQNIEHKFDFFAKIHFKI